MRNIGNTCYFNSLLQIYYTLPNFVKKILNFEVELPEDSVIKAAQGKEKLALCGMKLIQQLQTLFATMALGKKKYLDPSAVLESVVDEQGDQVSIGEEKDISEYNAILLTRI